MLDHRLPAVTSVLSAGLAASCCILPIALIAAGVASAGVMMSMMRYEWLTLPLGIAGLVAAFVVYIRRRRQWQRRVAGSSASESTRYSSSSGPWSF